MGHVGPRTILGRCSIVNNPRAFIIGHHTSLLDGWTLADLDPRHEPGTTKIRIGNYCTIMPDFQCNARVSVEIGDHVLVAPRVFISDSDHVVSEQFGPTTECREYVSAPVVIEHDCWIGVNAVVLKGVRIGHHSVIGANAVVTGSLPPLSRVGGVPARVLGDRNATAGRA
jgi:acetyltransferase-like isoleucine patch superfamily enzyme